MSVLFIANETFIEVPLLREIAPAMKIPGYTPAYCLIIFQKLKE